MFGLWLKPSVKNISYGNWAWPWIPLKYVCAVPVIHIKQLCPCSMVITSSSLLFTRCSPAGNLSCPALRIPYNGQQTSCSWLQLERKLFVTMAWGHSWSRHIMHEFKFSYNSLTNVMLIFFLFSKTEKLFRRQTGVLQWSWALRKSACCLWEWCFMVGAVLVLKVAVPLLSALKKKIIISKGRATSWSSTHDVPLQSWKQHCKWQSLGPWYPSTSTKKSRFFFFFLVEKKKSTRKFHIYLFVLDKRKKNTTKTFVTQNTISQPCQMN